ncbi:Gibberellin receptor GID1C [Linum perenne]
MTRVNDVSVNESKMVVPLNTWVLISNFKLAYNLLRRPDGTFNRHLAEFLDRKVAANANPVDGVFSFDVIVDRGTNLLCRIYRPSNGEEHPNVGEFEKPVKSESDVVPVIVFFHGGSFAHSSANSAIYDILCRRLVGLCKAVVVSVNYRRAPEHRYPCAYDDGWSVINWVKSRTWLESKDSKVHIFLAGDSSGGNIAHHVALRAAETDIEVLGNILLNPMFGGERRTVSENELDGRYFVSVRDRDWYWKAFLPDGADRDHPACNPFSQSATSLTGMKFPKSLVVVAGLDLVQDWQLAYVEGLKKSGQHVKHLYLEKATIGFYLLPNNAHFHTVMDEIELFVTSNC